MITTIHDMGGDGIVAEERFAFSFVRVMVWRR